jgi:DNA-binding transcriptional ArsR family regulator
MSRPSVPAAAPNPAPVFAALGDRTRLSILSKLSDGQKRSIITLSADTSLTRQAVSKHLRVLERAGLVSSIRSGRENQFAFRPRAVIDARSYLDTVSAKWDAALSRLQRLVEQDEGPGDAAG